MGRRSLLRTPIITLLAAVAACALALAVAACGDDDTPDAERDSARDRTSDTARDTTSEGDARSHDEAERETRAIAQELKELQRDAAESGSKLVEGSPAERDAAERELRAHERRARALASRADRALDAEERAELRAAARDTQDALEELRRFAREEGEDSLTRANEQLQSAEARLRTLADSLGGEAREPEVRRAIEQLRQRVPEIPSP